MPARSPERQYFVVRTLMPPCYGRPVELRHLRYFVAVADELNFTRAARRLRVAQPSLSRQIRQLEEEMGVVLFRRDRRSVGLTPAGQTFAEEARQILAHSLLAVRAAQGTQQEQAGSLNLGYVWGLFHSFAPEVINRFRKAHPRVTVNLFDKTATQQARALAEGTLDVGLIGFAHEADDAGLAKAKVGSCRFVAALPEKHPAARQRQVSLGKLSADSFFVISEEHYPGAFRFALEACVRAGFRPKVLQTAERGHNILGLVAGQCGVALLPEPLRELPHPGVVFRPLAQAVEADLFVAWARQAPALLREAFVTCAAGATR